MRQKLKNEKSRTRWMEKSKRRETRDESFYIPPAARLSTLFFRFAPSKRTQPLTDRRALLSASPCVFGLTLCKPRLSWVAEWPLRCPVASPLRRPLPQKV